MSDPAYYKFLNNREATHVPGFRYRLKVWQPAIKGELIPCGNAYHGQLAEDLVYWVARDLYVIESKDEWLRDGDKCYTRGPVRIIEHLQGWNKRTARLFAADCAERVLPNFEKRYPDDDRPRLAIQAARDYANGLISKKELAAAYSAYSAYSAAYSAARSAADSAERRWQSARILEYATGERA